VPGVTAPGPVLPDGWPDPVSPELAAPASAARPRAVWALWLAAALAPFPPALPRAPENAQATSASTLSPRTRARNRRLQ
jgi:hypothetical protein